MAKESNPADAARGAALREEINRILHPGSKNGQPNLGVNESEDEKNAVAPRDFIRKRMHKLNIKKEGPA
jgi:hypothetical protein